MVTVTDLIEDWIRVRTMLQQQLKALESVEHLKGLKELDPITGTTIARLKRVVGELNELLKEHARDSRT